MGYNNIIRPAYIYIIVKNNYEKCPTFLISRPYNVASKDENENDWKNSAARYFFLYLIHTPS